MFASKSTDHLAFVSRQLSHLLSDEELEPALQRLVDASPQQYARDVEYLRNLLSGSAELGPSLGPNPYPTLAQLLPAVGRSKNGFFRHFVEYVQQSKVVFQTYWVGVVGMIWYLAALAAVALGIAIIFGAMVYPSFDTLFAEFGGVMPDLTSTMFDLSVAGIPIVAVALAVVVGLVVWFVVLFHGRIQRLAPLPRWPAWTPVVGRIAESYNLGLFLNFADMLVKSDVEASRAVAEAARAANLPADLSFESLAAANGDFGEDPVLTELGVAAKLGYFEDEVAFQCDQHIGRMSLALVEARDRFSLILKFVLYLFVAGLVVAMYLPIFKMGSVI